MRKFLIDTIDWLVLLFVKWRYKLVMPTQKQMTEAELFFEKWKQKYPETFNGTKAVAKLSNIVVNPNRSIPLVVPNRDMDSVPDEDEQSNIDPFSDVPHGGRSNDLIEGPDNPVRNGENLSYISDIAAARKPL